MSTDTWNAVDDYLTATLVKPDADLEAALRDSEAAGLPAIAVSAPQGKLLHLLARIQGVRNILEIGTLGGYSTIWLARALAPGGRIISLEIDPKHAAVARANLARAGFANQAQVRVGRALDSLEELARESAGPFDFVFIDADKDWYTRYAQAVLPKLAPGGCLTAHNVSPRRSRWQMTGDFYDYITSQPDLETTFRAGVLVSCKRRNSR